MRVVVYGSRPDGHARVIIELFGDRFEVVGLLDDLSENAGRTIGELQIVGGRERLRELVQDGVEAVLLGFGGPRNRLAIIRAIQEAGLGLPACVHDQANVARSASFGPGAQVLPGATVGPGCRVGEGVLINAGAIVAHDVVIGSGTVVNPGAVLTGRSSVGTESEIGAGAVLLPDVSVGSSVTVGAGAVVTRDVEDGITVIGIPARPSDWVGAR
jgi:sugar O-acyltransferase (sialic acid O-acetyltransferase NeuD family)